MSKSPASVAVFMAVAAVAIIGLAFSSYYPTGASVSISPGPVFEEQMPHVIGSSKTLRCISDSYCPKDQSCVGKYCMDTRAAVARGLILEPSVTPEPVQNYAYYERGGDPWVVAPSGNNNDPSYSYEDYSRSNRIGTYAYTK